ncbi:putative methyltransferase domain containing protein [Tylopilus felleus]
MAREKEDCDPCEDVVVVKDGWLEIIATSMMTTTTMIQPPTSQLPPIPRIATFTTAQLVESVEYLYSLYRPQVRGSRRRRRDDSNDNGEDEDVRSDAFERAYAIRWLTALIAQLETRSSTPAVPSSPNLPIDAIDALIQQAASLLAICAGVAAAGKVQRQFTFDSTLVDKIHVDLTDIPLDNHDYASVGAQTWGGACVLAEMIAERSDQFGLVTTRNGPRPLRILELGAGTGLVGLTVAKLLLHASHANRTLHPQATIVLTDFYPAVLDNLQSNIDANFPTPDDADGDSVIRVTSHLLDWSSFSMSETTPSILSTPFDVVFGADIVYEAQHAVWIRDCLQSLLARPDGANEPVFHLVIPLRPTHTFESSTIEEVFGSKDCGSEGSHRELTILSKESIVCEAYGVGRAERQTDDDVEYVYYRIGWTP